MVTVTGGKWPGPRLVMKYLKAAVGPCYYLWSDVPGYESTAVEDEELVSVGHLLTIVMVVGGVLETQKGSLSTVSRSPRELATCHESDHG